MDDIISNDFIWSFSGKTGTKHVGRDSFDGHQTIAPHADVLKASSRVPSFHLCDDWLTDHRCSVPIEKRDVYQLLIKFSSPLLCPWVNCLQDTEIFSP